MCVGHRATVDGRLATRSGAATREDRTDDDIPQQVTVTRHGLPSSPDEARACLVPIYPPGPHLGRRIDLPAGPPFVVGRAPEANLRLADEAISRRNTQVERRGEHCAVLDLRSKNGTCVNGIRTSEQLLEDGALLVVGARS
jgi:hypothetical protein